MLPSRLLFLQAAAITTCGLLVVAVLNLYPNYDQLNHGIATGLVVIAALAFLMSRPWFGGLFVAGALLYSSLLSIEPTKWLWVLFDAVFFVLVAYFVYRATDSYGKGKQFEDYVANLFPQTDFVIEDRTRDNSKRLKRRVESDGNPDMTFRNIRTGERFAIECKWRGQWVRGTRGDLGLWWNPDHTERYEAYGQRLGIPVYVTLGIGGRPNRPQETYLLSVTQLKVRFLKQSAVRAGRTPAQFLSQ